MRRLTNLQEIKLDPLSDTFELFDEGVEGRKGIALNLLSGRKNPLPSVVHRGIEYVANQILRDGNFDVNKMRLYAKLWITLFPDGRRGYSIIIALFEIDGCEPYERVIEVLPTDRNFNAVKHYLMTELCNILFEMEE